MLGKASCFRIAGFNDSIVLSIDIPHLNSKITLHKMNEKKLEKKQPPAAAIFNKISAFNNHLPVPAAPQP